VHRIGRTGRAGRSGRAISFVVGREIWRLQQFMRVNKGRIRRENVPSQGEVEQRQASRLFDTLREVLEQGEFKRHDAFIDELLEAGHTPTDIASALIHLLSAETTGPGERISEDHAPRARPWARDDESGPRRKSSRKEPSPQSHEPGMVRLSLNLGRTQRVNPGDIVGFVTATAKISREAIGAIHVLPSHTLVDIAEESAAIVLELNGMQFKGRKLRLTPAG
nr:DbpA RNA binding domain-containing protein [Verrucomicrobiota bacterium]